ncbi:PREDICTED: beta-catenin-like protein 1, partial [Leptosomus discolor]|uniref:beta-catenin-like protein 1 n=1 Tax=Leptosomus discolor TaxID=188344 RepID=UPI000522A3C3
MKRGGRVRVRSLCRVLPAWRLPTVCAAGGAGTAHRGGFAFLRPLAVQHVCSILASLLRNLRGQQRTRLLNKFTENDSEKVDRLMELYFKYLDAMQAADKKIDGEKHDMVRRGEIIDDDMEDEFYLRRLDAGLFVLQLICYIMAEICNANVPQIRQRVHQILNMRGSSIKIVRHILK